MKRATQIRLLGALLLPVCALNLLVAWLGEVSVFPLSPFSLPAKAAALARYASHRAGCALGEGHPEAAPLIAGAERRHGVPPGLLAALVEVESASRPHRISPSGAMGLGQLLPGTADLLAVQDPFDSYQAIDASARYLAEQLRRFGRVDLALAAYNAGPGNVQGAVPQNGETELYVARILARWTPPKARATVARAPLSPRPR